MTYAHTAPLREAHAAPLPRWIQNRFAPIQLVHNTHPPKPSPEPQPGDLTPCGAHHGQLANANCNDLGSGSARGRQGTLGVDSGPGRGPLGIGIRSGFRASSGSGSEVGGGAVLLISGEIQFHIEKGGWGGWSPASRYEIRLHVQILGSRGGGVLEEPHFPQPRRSSPAF